MAPPNNLLCSAPGCMYKTPDGVPTWDGMISLLNNHTQAVHVQVHAASAPKLEKLPRPTFTLNMSESKWSFTEIQWNNYIEQSPNADESTKLKQLQAACDDELKQRIFDSGNYSSLNTTILFLAKMKELAVITVHKSVHLMNLWRMSQEPDESIRAFVARVTSTADMCGMNIRCTADGCNQVISYRDNVVQQIIIHGMHDNDVRIRVLSRNTAGELTTLPKLIDYIAAEEAGINESQNLSKNTVGGIRNSSYKKSKIKAAKSCGHCGGQHPFNDMSKNCKAFGKICNSCGKPNHLSNVCRSKPKSASTNAIVDDENDTGSIGSITSLWDAASSHYPTSIAGLQYPINTMRSWDQGPVTHVPLSHHVHDKIAGWLPSRPRDSPTILVSFTVDRPAYSSLNINLPKFHHSSHNPGRSTSKPAVADSGAQLTVIPMSLLENMNVKPDSIFPVSTRLNGASNAPIIVEGGILLNITATNKNNGISRTSHQLCYVSRHVSVSYLSFSACVDLGLLPSNFPEVGSCDTSTPASVQSLTSSSPTKCSNSGVPISDTDATCSCPRRELPPDSPPVLPCAPIPENVPQLRQYILDRYNTSAFNCCEHQPLRLMDSNPPMRIFVDEDAKPIAVHTPSQVPLHWQEAVKNGLDRDVRIGVLERVPVNDPVTWCSRMVIAPKPDGSPRRVVDYTALNKHAPRQTHHTESPWSIVSSIPANKIKSTVDCWHGYHSVPLHPADRHLTTFLTPWGRYRYKTVPQGLISAGDGYTQRRSEILDGFTDSKTCVDDSIIYDDSIEQNFYRVCEFLTISSRGGCTFNPKKFQFGLREINFLGFLVTNDGIKPTPQFIENIMNFPTPRSITDIRSWFGAINQISWSFAMAPIMKPLRHLLQAKLPFQWSPEMQTAFDESKQEILRQCEKGVKLFSPELPTALATDWSKFGVGFWLTQKHCKCDGSNPRCCETGWQTVYCGSRFCSSAESRYHSIEGEALATVYGLDKCKFFILGIKNLILCLDHKPLLAIFGKRDNIDDIHNPRLLNFRLKAMKYQFQVTHIPGKLHVVPDAFSRRTDSPISNPSSQSMVTAAYSDSLGPPAWVSPPTIGSLTTQHEEMLQGQIISTLALINASLSAEANSNIVSWQKLEAACLTDDEYQVLHKLVSNGVPDDKNSWDQIILDYYPHRHSLISVGPVILLYDRPVIPRSLRLTVMEHLHAGHASASSMFERASNSLYWPNFRTDLINYRAHCLTCSRYAPSNPSMPPTMPEEPSYPFQSICADFFSLGSRSYLVIVDRYSNWLTILKLAKDTTEETLKALRQFIITFGIPVTLTTDGARVFTASQFEEFCSKWGIIHRVSTAYNPQANKRAELAVKHAKRLIRGNTSQTGSLNTDNLVKALLIHRNTPSSDTGLSPAQVVFGRQVRDPLPLQPSKFFPRQEWRIAAKAREEALAKSRYSMQQKMSQHSRNQSQLQPGDHVFIQDQHGNTPKQWNRTGVVIEVGPHHSYQVSVDGSRNITKRNRKFLKKFTPVPAAVTSAPAPAAVTKPIPDPIPTPTPPVTINLDPQHEFPSFPPPASSKETMPLPASLNPIPAAPAPILPSIPFYPMFTFPTFASMLPWTWLPPYQAPGQLRGEGGINTISAHA